MRRHPPHHLSPAPASYRAGPDPEARLSRPKSPQQRSNQARKPVNSEQDRCSFPSIVLTPNAQHSEGSQAPAPWGSHGLGFLWYATFLAWICRSFVQPSDSRLCISIWISSWDPLKLCDAIRRTTSAPPGQNPGRARPRSAHSPLQSHRSNAPIKPVSQSNLSKIVALLTAIRARLPSVRIAPQLAGPSLVRSDRRAVRF